MFFDHTVFYDIWSFKVSKTTEIYKPGLVSPPNHPFLLHYCPIAHFFFNAPLEFLTAPRGAVAPTLGTTVLEERSFHQMSQN